MYRFSKAVMGQSCLDWGCDFLRFPLLAIPKTSNKSNSFTTKQKHFFKRYSNKGNEYFNWEYTGPKQTVIRNDRTQSGSEYFYVFNKFIALSEFFMGPTHVPIACPQHVQNIPNTSQKEMPGGQQSGEHMVKWYFWNIVWIEWSLQTTLKWK